MQESSNYFDRILCTLVKQDSSNVGAFWIRLDLEQLRRALPQVTDVLIDFGCGVAPYATALAPLFREVWLIDSSPRVLRTAVRRVAARAPTTDVRSLCQPFHAPLTNGPRRACVVLATGAATCYQHDSLALASRTASQLLKRGGVFIGEVGQPFGLLVSDAYASH